MNMHLEFTHYEKKALRVSILSLKYLIKSNLGLFCTVVDVILRLFFRFCNAAINVL